jgi:hypothetical protein
MEKIILNKELQYIIKWRLEDTAQWRADVITIINILGQLSEYSVWLQTGRSGCDPWQRQKIFPVAFVSRPPLKPTHTPIQDVPRVLSRGKARSVRGARCHLVSRSRMSRSYTSSTLAGAWSCRTALLYSHKRRKISWPPERLSVSQTCSAHQWQLTVIFSRLCSPESWQ